MPIYFKINSDSYQTSTAAPVFITRSTEDERATVGWQLADTSDDVFDPRGPAPLVWYQGPENLSFECPIIGCRQSFPSHSALLQHTLHPDAFPCNSLRLHPFLVRFVCPRCSKTLPYDSRLAGIPSHLLSCDGPDRLRSGDRCGFTSPTPKRDTTNIAESDPYLRRTTPQPLLPPQSTKFRSLCRVYLTLLAGSIDPSQLTCPLPSCDISSRPFGDEKELTTHLLNAHNVLPEFHVTCDWCGSALPPTRLLRRAVEHWPSCTGAIVPPPTNPAEQGITSREELFLRLSPNIPWHVLRRCCG